MKYCLTLLFCILPILAFSQNVEGTSLDLLSYEQLLSRFEEVEHDSILAEPIAREYLNRARREGDTIKMARGYDRLARIFHHEKNIAMADSLIALTKDMEHITYPGLGYMIKGYEYSVVGDLINSTKNFYLLYDYAKRYNNESFKIYSLSNLILTKAYFGDVDEAIQMQHEQMNIINKDGFSNQISQTNRIELKSNLDDTETILKLNAYLGYIVCYLQKKQLDSVVDYYKKYKYEVDNLNLKNQESFQNFVKELQLEINYHRKDYKEAIKISDSLIHLEKKDSNYSTHLDTYLFKGLSELNIGRKNAAYLALKKADSMFDFSRNDLLPYRRNIFQSLLQLEKERNNVDGQLIYLNKLIKADSILKSHYKYFESSIQRNFETPQLIERKQNLIDSLARENSQKTNTMLLFIALFVIALTTVIFFYFRNRAYKRRFLSLVNERKKETIRKNEKNNNEIPTSVIKEILDQLECFERGRDFIEPNITLHSLAKKFGTNERYLSKVINIKKGKHFPTYLNDLRVDYAMDRCQTDPMFKKFTIKAIAQESGFNSAESFSRAFYRKVKIYPSYYIKNLIKSDRNG
ncbi:helix-turn-helix domain-containing protein [Luteirhabdus pelagi]|uniref:helix-turn-helix domain-containing protein n=1 Tax=Luteirhabdus pelagi TaxID=2792783 RepID=UPI001939CDB3|nr:helix-turn-helix domain-containing protein [Luteirhabdus pelagi]